MKAYHFSKMDGLTRYTNEPIIIGQRLEAKVPLELCVNGLHGSKSISGALQFAPGGLLHIVELEGDILRDDHKCCAQYRTALVTVDFTEGLKQFAYWCANRAKKYADEALMNVSNIGVCSLSDMPYAEKHVERAHIAARGAARYAVDALTYADETSRAWSAAAYIDGPDHVWGARYAASSAICAMALAMVTRMYDSENVTIAAQADAARHVEWVNQEVKLQKLFKALLTPEQKEALV